MPALVHRGAKPAAAPEGATYVVVRRLTGPEGRVAYETLDYASVEGTGADARVVTASAPFAGYISSINGYAAMGLDVGGGASGQLTNYALLLWAFDQAMPGRPMGGTITGKVVRTVWAAGAAEPTYEPVVGALVSGVDVQGQPLWALAPGPAGANVAVTQADGTYALWDWAFAGGAVTVSATVGGQTQTATAYEVAAPDLTRSPGLRFTRTVAHATVVFPPAAPTTPVPLLGVSVLAETASGLAETNGLVTVGTPLRVRVRDDRAAAAQATSDLTVQSVTIGGEARSASRQADGTVLSDAPWTPTQVGAVTVTATALAPGGGVLTASVTLRVLAAGGSINEPLLNDPPAVITALTLPKAGATGVPVTVYPQVTFTEPVTHVVEGVTLEQLAADGDTVVATVPVTLLGVGPAGPVALDVNNAPIAAVTSLTIQPTVGLAYATRYRLRLDAPIVDTDTDAATGAPAPKALVPVATTFTTFGPEAIGQTETTFVSPGIVLIDTRGYVATPEVSGPWEHAAACV